MNSTPQPPEPDKKASREEIEADIEATRERLADDVAALAAKADVPGQVRAKVQETRGNVGHAARRAQQQATQKVRALPRPVQLAIPAAMAALGAVLVLTGLKRPAQQRQSGRGSTRPRSVSARGRAKDSRAKKSPVQRSKASRMRTKDRAAA